MEFVNNILNSLKIPIIIWKDNISIYSNTDKCVQGTHVDKYLENGKIDCYKEHIVLLMNTKLQQDIRLPNRHIILEYIDTTKYYEIHYPTDEKNSMLALIIHKIRKPLTSIMNIISLDEKDVSTHAIVKQSCYNILEITNDLVDILNINKNKLSIENKIFNIADVTDDMIRYIQTDAENKNIYINKLICENISKNYYGDYDKIKQIIINVLRNSVKYTVVGGVQVEIKEYTYNYKCPFTIKKRERVHNILFKIKDTGIGMNDDIQDELMTLFNIPTGKKDKNDKLRGFGLFISYHLCRFLDGYIWYRSERDVGTVFYIVIPLIPN